MTEPLVTDMMTNESAPEALKSQYARTHNCLIRRLGGSNCNDKSSLQRKSTQPPAHTRPGGCTQGASVTTLAPTLIEHLDFLHHAAHLRSRTRLGIFSACSRAAMEGMYSTRGSSCAPRPNTCATATTVKNEVFPLAPGCCGWMPPPRSAGPARLGLRIAARYAVRLQPGTEHIALGGY